MQNLEFFPRTGIEHSYFSEETQCFEVNRVSNGIDRRAYRLLIDQILPQITNWIEEKGLFGAEQGFVHKPGAPRGHIPGREHDDSPGIEYCPGGIPDSGCRHLFLSEDTHRTMCTLVMMIRKRLVDAGFGEMVEVMLGGDSTIDIRPRGKRSVIEELILPREPRGTIPACGGDRIGDRCGNDESMLGVGVVCFDVSVSQAAHRLPLAGQCLIHPGWAKAGGTSDALAWINEANLLHRIVAAPRPQTT